ncbi:MAG: thioredoxin family protein [Bacillota bacterium]
MIELNEEGVINLLKSGEKVLLDFYTPSCGGCKVLAYQLEEADAHTLTPIVKVDATTNESLAARFGIMKVPQLVLVKNNMEIDRHPGFLPADQILEFINKEEQSNE